jgi:hypothetical protein
MTIINSITTFIGRKVSSASVIIIQPNPSSKDDLSWDQDIKGRVNLTPRTGQGTSTQRKSDTQEWMWWREVEASVWAECRFQWSCKHMVGTNICITCTSSICTQATSIACPLQKEYSITRCWEVPRRGMNGVRRHAWFWMWETVITLPIGCSALRCQENLICLEDFGFRPIAFEREMRSQLVLRHTDARKSRTRTRTLRPWSAHWGVANAREITLGNRSNTNHSAENGLICLWGTVVGSDGLRDPL